MITWPGTSIPKSAGNAFDWRAGMPPPVETRVCTKADAALPEMAKVWRDEARRAASDVARLVALREPATVAAMEQARGLV